MCGTFTRNQQDDFLTPDGDMETSIAAFASKFQVAGEGRYPLEDSAPLAPCSTRTQRHISAEAACAILHGTTFQVTRLEALLLTNIRWCRYLPCPPPGLLGGPHAVEHGEMAVGTTVDRGTCGEADPLPGLPSRSVMGSWTGSRSTCAAWQPCVAVPLAGPACAPCSLPLLVTVPGRVPCLPRGPRPSAVSVCSWLAPPQGLPSQPSLGTAQRDPRAVLLGRLPRRTSDCGKWLSLPSFRGRASGGSRGVGRAAAAMCLISMCVCAQLSCVLGARSTRSVPQHAVKPGGSQKTVGTWAAVWLVVTALQGCCGTLRASACPPACAPASLEPIAMPLAVPSWKTATTGKGGSLLWGGKALMTGEVEPREKGLGL